MIRGLYILPVIVLSALLSFSQKTVIKKDGRVVSVHKERRNKQIHITYHENGQKATWMKITPEWVKEKEWYPSGQKKKVVMYSQVSFTAEYRKYKFWDEEGNKKDNVALPEEAILIADYTEVGDKEEPLPDRKKAQQDRKRNKPIDREDDKTVVFNTHNEPAPPKEKEKSGRRKTPDPKEEKALIEFEVPDEPASEEEWSETKEQQITSIDLGPDVEEEMESLEETTPVLHVGDVSSALELAEQINPPPPDQEKTESQPAKLTYDDYDLAMNEPLNDQQDNSDQLLLGLDNQGEYDNAGNIDREEETNEKEVEETEETTVSLTAEERSRLREITPIEPEDQGHEHIAEAAQKSKNDNPEKIYASDGTVFSEKIAEGDMAFDNGDYELAKQCYAKAAEANSKAIYPQDRLRQIQMMEWHEKGGLVVTEEQAYSGKNPIPVDAPIADGLVYRVQIVALAGEVSYEAMPSVVPILGMTVRGRLIRYMAGEFRTFEEAQRALSKIHALGFTEAFVIAFEDGQYIPVEKAKSIQKHQAQKEEELLTSF